MREHKPSIKADQFLWIQIYGIVPSTFSAIKKKKIKAPDYGSRWNISRQNRKRQVCLFVLLMKKNPKEMKIHFKLYFILFNWIFKICFVYVVYLFIPILILLLFFNITTIIKKNSIIFKLFFIIYYFYCNAANHRGGGPWDAKHQTM